MKLDCKVSGTRRKPLDVARNREGVIDGTPFTPNNLNQYAETSNGSQHEMTGYGAATYRYLADTFLAEVSVPSQNYKLGYDALGRCVRRQTNRQVAYFAYDGARAILDYNAAGAITANALYGIGIDEIIARNNNGQGQFLHQDRLGSTTAVTGFDGTVLESYRYDAFGAPTIKSATGAVLSQTAINNRVLFTGREWVAQQGFYEYRARAYNPKLGRFMSEDPLGFAAGDANLYRYCGGDPVNRVDPSGLFDWRSFFAKIFNEFRSGGTATAERVTVSAAALPGSGLTSNGGGDWRGISFGGPEWGLLTGGGGSGDGGGFSIRTGVVPMPFFGNPTIDSQPLSSPSNRLDNPDYIAASVNISPFTPYTLTLLGTSFNLFIDRYGTVYFAIGGQIGRSPEMLSVNATANYLNQSSPADPQQLGRFLTNWSYTGAVGSFAGGNATYSPGNGVSYGFGVFVTPQFGGSAAYGIRLINVPTLAFPRR